MNEEKKEIKVNFENLVRIVDNLVEKVEIDIGNENISSLSNETTRLIKSDYITKESFVLYRLKAITSGNGFVEGDLGGYIDEYSYMKSKKNFWLGKDCLAWNDVKLGHNVYINDTVEISNNCNIQSNAVIRDNVSIQKSFIQPNSTISSWVVIDNCCVGENVSVYGAITFKDMNIKERSKIVIDGDRVILQNEPYLCLDNAYDSSECRDIFVVKNKKRIYAHGRCHTVDEFFGKYISTNIGSSCKELTGLYDYIKSYLGVSNEKEQEPIGEE